ncbi:MAG: 30S ribosomal protein S21 [Bradyrhizobium sp.]|uniref:30S ribosomal protein S21 n=1 Tax=Bradyrhizobium sp. TaxID=376 RepID=UPI001C29791E|nr:30S ribosomal protein S21 [Bradyrhizobium sp.]MBU6461631.1 30S ribosomal protein S21 [Pseudomonadota bacterium]MDE2067538.1 30S ribosomal protein S21 [Bradyrhizobium sp.]MDE2241386.1 30S ribosomal protein S21 [Bradyrhizobium sp.]MDE2472431.1 30S ribosomal protein S21 [Bradyrhizobium sp.]
MQVFVRDNNVNQALRILKKKMQREGVFREIRRKRFYEKPSEKATREKADAVRRSRKLARKQAIRDGLIAGPIRKLSPVTSAGRVRALTSLGHSKAKRMTEGAPAVYNGSKSAAEPSRAGFSVRAQSLNPVDIEN